MNTKIAASLLLSLLISVTAHIAVAQQLKNIPRIAYASGGPGDEPFEAFRQRLRELGYVEGQNILIDYRDAGGRLDRMPEQVHDLLKQKVDVLVMTNNVVILAAKKATKTIPIVMRTSLDPVAAGYVANLARPGGNITGLTNLLRDLSAKRLELFKEVLPKMSRVAILWDIDGPGPKVAFKEYEAAARILKLRFQSLSVHGPEPDLNSAFQAAKKERAGGLIIISNPLMNQYRKQALELAIKNRLPSLNENRIFVSDGGLMSYAPDPLEQYRRLAYYVDRILKGAKPADLPVEQPTKYELVINLKTAKHLGLAIPQNVLLMASKLIE